MTNITQTHLEAALIDQNVAGQLHDKRYAFVTVTAKGWWQLGVAVANEPGYHPINKFFNTKEEADKWADGLNEHIGLSEVVAFAIIGSTMGGQPVAVLS